MDYRALTGPVLVTGGTRDRMISTEVPRQTAARYANGKYVDVEGADHMQIFGPFLPLVLRHIDQWIDGTTSPANRIARIPSIASAMWLSIT